MGLARCDSMVILRYAKDAHLMTIMGEFRRGPMRNNKNNDADLEDKLSQNKFDDRTLSRLKEL